MSTKIHCNHMVFLPKYLDLRDKMSVIARPSVHKDQRTAPLARLGIGQPCSVTENVFHILHLESGFVSPRKVPGALVEGVCSFSKQLNSTDGGVAVAKIRKQRFFPVCPFSRACTRRS